MALKPVAILIFVPGKENFCSFNWSNALVHLNSGRVNFCCKTPPIQVTEAEIDEQGISAIYENKRVVQNREKLLKGERPKDCSYCWQLEDKGLATRKDRGRKKHEYFGSRKVSSETSRIHMLEIVLENTCQMNCIYCCPQYSSSWSTKAKKDYASFSQSAKNHFFFEEKRSPEFLGKFRDLFFKDLPSRLEMVTEVNFIGGEPLIQKDFFKILKMISDLTKDRIDPIEVRIITNLSIHPQKYKDILKVFQEVEEKVELVLAPSLDCLGEKIEFIRGGLNFDWFLENINQSIASQCFSKIEFINTMSCLSVFGLPEFIQFYGDLKKNNLNQNFGFWMSQVAYPSFLAPLNLGRHYAPIFHEIFKECDQLQEFPEIVQLKKTIQKLHQGVQGNSFQGFNPDNHQDFRDWIRYYEGLTGLSFEKVFDQAIGL